MTWKVSKQREENIKPKAWKELALRSWHSKWRSLDWLLRDLTFQPGLCDGEGSPSLIIQKPACFDGARGDDVSTESDDVWWALWSITVFSVVMAKLGCQLHAEVTKTQAAVHIWEGFFLVDHWRSHKYLKSVPQLLVAACIKEECLCFLSICPPPHWWAHLFRAASSMVLTPTL